jgi:acetyltransferase-like isoleucine patch superfamily enzyme
MLKESPRPNLLGDEAMNFISSTAKIGKNVKFGNFVTVHDGVTIGDDSIIESYCELGYSNGRERGPLQIGRGAHIRSHSVLYLGTSIGDELITGHHVVVRENSTIGSGFQLGASSIVMGELTIGDYVKTGSQVEIGQHSRVGSCVWIFINSMLCNDPRPPSNDVKGPDVDDFAIIGAGCTIFPGVRIGKDVLVGAGCVLSTDVPEGQIALGNPSRIIGPVSKIKMPDGSPAYPWRHRFHRGYPQELVARWIREAANLA